MAITSKEPLETKEIDSTTDRTAEQCIGMAVAPSISETAIERKMEVYQLTVVNLPGGHGKTVT